ncbi:class I SAM-dependent methyltransferase [Streptomyces sp. TRM68416]|uniref:class I SAM-dependent methyltransferase n=1 Tax=Streptomyces sp. TRM68416 TaxID=2758412 RepID=UPI001661F27E|nr:class I SAM-dependent methyltransferase [Streptomyces sp. TRM68416]MBD0844183.1 class I SAM-dependent methyltransferase [Streptomyces sp. TRM68416]
MTETVEYAELQYGWEKAYQDQNAGPLWQEDPIPVIPQAIDTLKQRNTHTVVDLGCGDGRNLAALADAGFNALGVDIAPTGLAHARRVIKQRSFLLRADATKLPLIDASVDAVTCFDVFGQIQDPSHLIAEARRIVAPGGLFVTNAFTLEDGTYGEGDEIAPHTFAYKDTLFRFYSEDEMRGLFSDWTIHEIRRISWDDPPHGDFRPYPHTHDNWVVYATPQD